MFNKGLEERFSYFPSYCPNLNLRRGILIRNQILDSLTASVTKFRSENIKFQ